MIRKRSHHAYHRSRHKKIFRPPQYQKRTKWPQVKLKEVMREAGIFMVCEDHVILTRKEIMRFYFNLAKTRKSQVVQKAQKKLEDLTSKDLANNRKLPHCELVKGQVLITNLHASHDRSRP